MSDLVEFVKARVDEEEEAARAASHGGRWRYEPGDSVGAWMLYDEHWSIASVTTYDTEGYDYSARMPAFRNPGYVDPDANGRHIARHDPARALREVEAKRRILELHTPQDYGHITYADGHTVVTDWACYTCRTGEMDSDGAIEPDPAPCDTLRALASIWSTHSDFNEEWAL